MLVSVAWLATRLADPQVRIVDVRWYLTEPGRGYQDYLTSHIPGAVYLDIDHDLSSPKGQGPGRHPLPSAAAFAAVASRIGIGPETHVVVYDATGGAYATRLWWLLRYMGHQHVSLLDGGWPAWVAADQPVTAQLPTMSPTQFVATPQPRMVVQADQVEELRHNASVLVLDARARERYLGLVEPIDAKAGHIPGAKSAPYSGNLQGDGQLLPVDQLRERFQLLGAEQAETIVCYCGSGVTATHNLFALALTGREDGLLYEGSWSDWSSHPDRPVATGEQ